MDADKENGQMKEPRFAAQTIVAKVLEKVASEALHCPAVRFRALIVSILYRQRRHERVGGFRGFVAILAFEWQNRIQVAQAKANKREILTFIEEREIITPYDLMEWFDYTYSYASKKLSLFKKQALVQDLGNTPSTYGGQWCLTNKGYERPYYLQRKTQKHGVEKVEAKETEKELRRLRNRVEKLESHPWIIYEELAPVSKELCGVPRPMAIIETRKLPHDVLPYRRKFNRLLVEAEGIIKRLPEEERAKVEALLFKDFKPNELKLFFLRKLG